MTMAPYPKVDLCKDCIAKLQQLADTQIDERNEHMFELEEILDDPLIAYEEKLEFITMVVREWNKNSFEIQ